jgi:hypothetical protein
MSYFAAALLFLLCGLALMAGGFGYPDAGTVAPQTLVVVHVIAIGWLGLLFCGALLQFIPVLAARPLRMGALSFPALASIVAGLLCLVLGFLSLADLLVVSPRIMMFGAVLLFAGLLSLAAAFASTVLAQKKIDLPSRLVLLGLLALCAAISMGVIFAGSLSGAIDATWSTNIVAQGIPLHAAWGILGWMTLTAAGVGYRLFSMFMLAPDGGFSSRRVTACVCAALLGLLLSLAAVIAGAPSWTFPATLGLLAALLAAIFYLRDIVAMLRTRRRKQLELNSMAGLSAFGFLALGLLLLAGSLVGDIGLPVGPVAYYLLAMGWLSGLGLAQLYKIIPFLTWLEAFGPVMGRSPVPRVQDLCKESRARGPFAVYYVSVLGGAVCLLFDLPYGFRTAAALQLVAVAALMVEYVRARLLSYAPAGTGLPTGAVRPHLVYARPD